MIAAATTPVYRYRLKSMRDSSAKYGVCEVCKKHAAEVFLQVEEQQYWLDALDAADGFTEPYAWTQFECHSLFGHSECLEARRR